MPSQPSRRSSCNSRIPVVLDGIIGTSGEVLRHLSPPGPHLSKQAIDRLVLFGSPLALVDWESSARRSAPVPCGPPHPKMKMNSLVGSRWLCQRSLHCLPVLEPISLATPTHFSDPYCWTSASSLLSSSLVQGPRSPLGLLINRQRSMHSPLVNLPEGKVLRERVVQEILLSPVPMRERSLASSSSVQGFGSIVRGGGGGEVDGT